MNINKLTVTTVIILAIALPTGRVLSQEKESTLDQNLNKTEQGLDNVSKDLKDTGNAAKENVNTTGDKVVDDLKNTDNVVEENVDQAETKEVVVPATETDSVVVTETEAKGKFNWGWFGLLGLLGLLGLITRKRTTEVAHRDLELEPLIDTAEVRNVDVNNTNLPK